MIEKNTKVTVVIPCYNDKEYIIETLNSVLNQTFKDFEIIIVDDGSDDETKHFLEEIQLSKVSLIRQSNKGLSAARNIGIQKAKSDFLLIIDADDTVDVSFLEKAISILKKHDHIGAVSSYCNIFTSPNKIIGEHKPKGGVLKDFLLDNNSVSFALIRREAWESVNGYDEKMINGFEDWEFWISITKKQWSIYVIPELLFNYRRKDRNSLSKSAKLNYRESNLNYIFKKHSDIYINHFPEVIDYLTNLANRNKKNEIKYKTSLDFRIGRVFLFPIRKLKRIFQKR